MSFGYLGDTSTKIKQQVKNQGVISISEAYELEKAGHLGGSLKLISSTTFSSQSQVDITSGFTGFDVFHISCTEIVPSTNANFGFQLFESGTIEDAGVYKIMKPFFQVDGGSGEEQSGSASRVSGLAAVQTTDKAGIYLNCFGFTDGTQYSFVTHQNAPSYTADYETKFGGAVLPQASVVDGIRFTMNTGTFSGKINLYGYKT